MPNLTTMSDKPSTRLVRVAARITFFFSVCLFGCVVSAQAQVSSLTMISDSGDYIGGGQFYYYTPSDVILGNKVVRPKLLRFRSQLPASITGGIWILLRRVDSPLFPAFTLALCDIHSRHLTSPD